MKPSTSPPKLLAYPAILIGILLFYFLSAPVFVMAAENTAWERVAIHYYLPLTWLDRYEWSRKLHDTYFSWVHHTFFL